MKSKGEQEFNSYLDRVDELYKDQKISRSKRDRLLMTASAIPEDFIDRDLRQTQFISRRSMEILSKAIRNVYASSGVVTDFFRHAWGYDTILHDLNLPRYEEAGLTEDVEYESHGQKHIAHRIKDWSKRKDHRHHALDALVVALTRQGYVQRLNTLNSKSGENDEEWKGLDRWASERPHIERESVMKALDEISVSFKSGKKLTTPGKRYIRKNGKRICVQTGVSVPRSPLHKDTVYGSIMVDDGEKKLKYALENLDLVKDMDVRRQLEMRLRENGGDIAKTLKVLKKNPIEVNEKTIETVRCFRKEIVVKYPLESIGFKDLRYIVDSHIREIIEQRFSEVGNKDKDFVRSLSDRPLYSDKGNRHKIKTVRLMTGLNFSTLAGIRKNEKGDIIGYAQTRNNHHAAFYRNREGKIVESVVSFWDCVKRKNVGLPAIIRNPEEAWDALIALGDFPGAEDIAKTLPAADSEFVISLQRNEMVVLGMSDDEWNDAVSSNDIRSINRKLYRVWKLGAGEYCFKYQTNTSAAIIDGDKELKQYYRITSVSSLMALHPRKVNVSLLGKLKLSSDDKENSML